MSSTRFLKPVGRLPMMSEKLKTYINFSRLAMGRVVNVCLIPGTTFEVGVDKP